MLKIIEFFSLTIAYDAYVDEGNKIVTTAAFMYDGPFHLIHDGIGELISKVITLTKQRN